MPRTAVALLLCLLALAPVRSQSCGGNGGADLRPSTMVIGRTFTADLVGPPGQAFVLAVSGATTPTIFPGIGTVCLDFASPLFLMPVSGVMPAGGILQLAFPIASDPLLVGAFFYAQLAVVNPAAPGGLGLSKAVRIQVAAPGSFETLPIMGAQRALHVAVALGDGRVLVAGGGNGTLTAPVGTNTTEIWDPLTRTFAPGPLMAAPRALHAAVRLLDGRVAILGGTDSAGLVTPTCDLFDPATGTISAGPPMPTGRCGHTATLLADGRVLVTGGVTTFQGGSTALAQVLNTALNSAILLDAAATSWTAASGVMAQKRFGHGAVRLDDGRVLVISGINGGTTIPIIGTQVPTWTTSCNIFDPGTGAFSTTGSIATGRAAFGATLLPGGAGNVLVTGGVVSGLLSVPTATTSCQRFNGTTWSAAGTLPTGVGLHGQVRLPDGTIHISGGGTGTLLSFTAVTSAATYSGTTLSPAPALPVPRGAHSATVLHDGAILLAGGSDASGTAVDTAVLYTP